MSTLANVELVHPDGRANVRPDLDAMLGGATRSLRAAVCFFTDAGRLLLSRHVSQLNQADSFFVASVDTPTNLKALEKLCGKPGLVTYNLGTNRGYSVLELVQTFEKVSGKKVPYRIVERRPGDIAISYADVSKAEQELGWQALRGIEEMCHDAWRWQSGNPDGYS